MQPMDPSLSIKKRYKIINLSQKLHVNRGFLSQESQQDKKNT